MQLSKLKRRKKDTCGKIILANCFSLLFIFSGILAYTPSIYAQSFNFTYQGKLDDGGHAANGVYDMQFALFDAAAGGNQIGSTLINASVQVNQGIFTVTLNFGGPPAFSGPARYLEISVKPQGGQSSYTLLAPRHSVSSVPYSIRSLTSSSAELAADSNKLGGKDPSQFAGINDSRLSDMRNPLPGAPSYIQNTNNQQAASSFNISGNGKIGGLSSANSFDSATHYQIAGTPVLRVNGSTSSASTFVGINAGPLSTGGSNSFFGTDAGKVTTNGGGNSFFGVSSGEKNTASYNSLFGFGAGTSNTSGISNSYFGNNVGLNSSTGSNNAFFGAFAGAYGNPNNAAAFGTGAGLNNSGTNNSFFGDQSGITHKLGSNVTILGAKADVAAASLSNATAVGANAQVSQSDSLVLGSINGVNGGGANTNVGIGTTAPKSRLHIADNNGNIMLGNGGCNSGFAGIGFASTLTCGNYSLLGDGSDTVINRPSLGVIEFRENNITQMAIGSGGRVSINALGTAGSTPLCRNNFNQISNCSSSLRYKKNINPFTPGLNLVRQLKPITFDWKDGGMRDLGLGAEDVAKVNDLLVIHDEKGEVEGVKYDRIGVVLINAVKEQQTEITELKNEVRLLHNIVTRLRKNRNNRSNH